MDKKNTAYLTQFAMLLAIETVVCFTTLGSLPAMGPIVMTLSHIPVALAGIIMGVGAGAAMGACTGLFSICVWTFMPPVPSIAFAFSPSYSAGDMYGIFGSIVVSVVPRVLIGVVAALSYRGISSRFAGNERAPALACLLAAVFGSLTNTFGVLGGMYLIFGHSYAAAIGVERSFVLSALGMQILTNGVPEAILCALVAVLVRGPVKRVFEG